MRIDRRVPALVLAAMLGTALGSGCQRKDNLVPSSDMAAPSRQEDRPGTAARSGSGEERPARPGSPDALGQHHFVPPQVPNPFLPPPYEPIDTQRDLVET